VIKNIYSETEYIVTDNVNTSTVTNNAHYFNILGNGNIEFSEM